MEKQLEYIDKGEVEGVIQMARAMAGENQENPLGELAGFLQNQREHLDYASAREQGLPIGSGMVEGGHRHVIQERLKLPGTWWKEENVNPMVALRTLREKGGGRIFGIDVPPLLAAPNCNSGLAFVRFFRYSKASL